MEASIMKSQDFFDALVSARGLPEAVERISGAFSRHIVISNTGPIRSSEFLVQVKSLSIDNQASFIKSLALYEQTIGGLGSTTSLLKVFEVIDDPGHEIFDWVINNTTSYDYFARGFKSYADLEVSKKHYRARVSANRKREAQRAAEGELRRAKKASSNLINAINRGDIKAVEALLLKGARPDTLSNGGLLAADFAKKAGHPKISKLIRNWNN